jgi:predicted acylesterase/phospholipase RssA
MNERRPLPSGTPIDLSAPYRILSLSGGGYRGLFSAELLAKIESMPELEGKPIGLAFDMIAGTSAGGLIAVALAHGVRASRVVEILEKHGPRIFPRLLFKSLSKLLNRQVYSAEPLKAAVRECIGTAASKPFAELSKSVMLPTVSWTGGRLVLLRSGTLDRFDNPNPCTVLDATCATAAAPAHFPAHPIGGDWYVDGGLVANCPDLHAFQQVEHLERKVMMLSIGTAGMSRASTPNQIPQRGLTWAEPALDLGIQAQETHTRESCARLLKEHYLHLNQLAGGNQKILNALDIATPDATTTLKTLARTRFKDLSENPAELRRLKFIIGTIAKPTHV